MLKRVKALGGVLEDWARELMTRGLIAYEELAMIYAGVYSVSDGRMSRWRLQLRVLSGGALI